MAIAGIGNSFPIGTNVTILAGTGSPEGVVTAIQGSLWLQTNDTNRFVVWGKASGSGNTGWQLLAVHAGPHGDINYVSGDGTIGGQLRVYSQIVGYGAPTGGGADLVLIAGKHRSGGTDYDVHIAAERVGGVNGTGVCFMDIDIKVADYTISPARGHGLRVLQTDNSPVIEFPISGGIIDLDARIRGRNGANKNLILRLGDAAGQFIVENFGGSQCISVTDDGTFMAVRIVETVIGLPSQVNPSLNAALGNYFRCSIATNIAVVVQIPTNKPAAGLSQEITIEFINASGGALGTAPTFATGADGFLFSAVTNPAAGTSVFYKFRWSSPRSRWVEVGTHLAAGI